MKAKFKSVLRKEDFGMSGTTQVFGGKFNEIGKYRVGAKQIISFGAGNVVLGNDLREPVYVVLKDSNDNLIKGKIRFVVTDANEVSAQNIDEQRVEVMNIPPTDKVNSYKLGESAYAAGEDAYLKIEFKPDSDATIDWSQSEVHIPVTVMML